MGKLDGIINYDSPLNTHLLSLKVFFASTKKTLYEHSHNEE